MLGHGLEDIMDFDLSHGAVRAVAAFAFVIGLILILSATYKKWAQGRRGGLGRGRDKRLGIIEVASIDPRRQLVLVRRDDQEHLLLIGGANDVVIEVGIARPIAVAKESGPRLHVPERNPIAAPLPTAPVRREPTMGGGT